MTGSGVSPTQLDAAAEAICAATSSGQMFPWSTLNETDRDAWRRMAQAAIDALNLTEEEVVVPEVVGRIPCTCGATEATNEELHSCGFTRGHFEFPTKRRLVSSWVSVVVEENPQ